MQNKYQVKKAAVRETAINWQLSFADSDHSYDELAATGAKFAKLGKRYGLLKEFRENGII